MPGTRGQSTAPRDGGPRSQGSEPGEPWWRDAVGYEVYVRSFADSDGDGTGDLRGITSRLDHLVHLGVDLLWITPFFPSPMADFGYDISDYCDVDPLFGSLADFDELIAAAHDRDLRVIIDVVPNHTSSHHPWFEEARRSRSDPRRDFYIWADPGDDCGPPNNWISHFGGPAWTLDETTGQYYCHLFLPEQPDLNWANPAVRDAFDGVLEFWLDRGVDGFRIDVAHALSKDPELRSNPQLGPWDPTATRWEQWAAFSHDHELVQPANHDIYRRWRAIAGPRQAVLLGETYVDTAQRLAALLTGDGLDLGFWFQPMHIDWDAATVRSTLAAPLDALAEPRMIGWAASSHDEVRAASRFGDGDQGRSRALAFSTLLFGLPGLPFLYMGEELGLLEGVVPEDRRADPVGATVTLSRDGCRTPMPWEPGRSFGFSSTTETWLPDGGRTDADTVAEQFDDPGSWLNRYRRLIAVRKSETDLISAPIEWLDGDGGLVAYRRDRVVVAANLGSAPLPTPGSGSVLFSSSDRAAGPVPARLEPDEAVIFRSDG